MKYKIKKCLSIMLTLCMVLSLLSGATVTANADGGVTKLYVNGVDMLSKSSAAPTGVSYNIDTNTLTLNNTNLNVKTQQRISNSNSSTYAIIYAYGGDLTIELKGQNTITYSENASYGVTYSTGIFCDNTNLTFKGDGSLNLKNKVSTGETIGIYCNSGNLTIDNTTVQCDKDKSDTDLKGNAYGVSLIGGTLTMNGGNLEVYTRDVSGGSKVAVGIAFSSGTAEHKLTGDAELVAVAGENGLASDYSYGIKIDSNKGLKLENIGENARLYFSGKTDVVSFFGSNTSFVKTTEGTLSVKSSTTYNALSDSMSEANYSGSAQITKDHISANYNDKTIEITKKVNYASAALTMKGYKAGRAINNAAIEGTAAAVGLSGITLDGFYTDAECSSAASGNFDSTQAYFAKVSITKTSEYSLKLVNGIPTAVTLDGKAATKYDSGSGYLVFDMGTPGANVNTTRVTTLDLSTIGSSNTQGAIYDDSTKTYTNEDEGWTWDSGSKTLTLENCTIEVEDKGHGIIFPESNVKLILKGTNRVIGGKANNTACALYQSGNYSSITVSEENGSTGTLTAGTNSTDSVIRCGTFTLNSGTVTLENTNASQYNSGSGLELAQNLKVTGGTLNALGFKYSGITCLSKATISGGHVTVSGNRHAIEGNAGNAIGNRELNIDNGEKLRIKAGDSADTAKKTTDEDIYRQAKYIDIDFNPTSEPAVFTDGFGGTVVKEKLSEYTKGTTKHGDYTFAGWFDEAGTELTDTSKAENDTTYTARWKAANGKFVRTKALDFSNSSDTSWQTGCIQSGSAWVNQEEGWQWDRGTLTLFGATIDVPETAEAEAAIKLPRTSTINIHSDANIVRNSGVSTAGAEQNGNGIFAIGALTVEDEGKGTLSISGKTAGLYAEGNLDINAAFTAEATGTGGIAVLSDYNVNLYPRWSVKEPAGGTVINDHLHCIADNSGNPAAKAVIDIGPATFTDGFGNSIDKTTVETYSEGQTKHPSKTEYTFAGWYDEKGSKLHDSETPQDGMLYTAKWKNAGGKTVRTTNLDLIKLNSSNYVQYGATYNSATSTYTNGAEGWTWNSASSILTLDDCTIDTMGEPGIEYNNSMTIKLIGSNVVKATATSSEANDKVCGIDFRGNQLTIMSDDTKSTLETLGTYAGIGSSDSKGTVVIQSGTVTAEGINGVDCRSLEVSGGILNGKGTKNGIFVEGSRYTSYTSAIQNNGVVNATGGEYGINSNTPLTVEGTLTAQGGSKQAVLINGDTTALTLGRDRIADTNTKPEAGKGKYDPDKIASYKWLHVRLAETYTVTYNINGGTEVDPVPVMENNNKLNQPDNPTKEGYNFVGWYKDEALTRVWDFANDTVTSDMTLYAKWSEVPVYSISGIVDRAQNSGTLTPVSGATVELKKGSEVIANAETNAKGEYILIGVPSGEYNIVVTKDNSDGTTEVMTKLITVSGADQTDINITLPEGKVSAIVEVKADVPPVLVGGLDAEVTENHGQGGKTVEVKLSVKKTDAENSSGAAEIKKISGGQVLEYLDVDIEKTVKDLTTGNKDDDLSGDIFETSQVLEIVVPFQTSGRKGIKVYRHHTAANGTDETKAFTSLKTRPDAAYEDGTYYVGDGFVVIYTNKFSTYAIGYTKPSGSHNVQKPEITANNGGKAELSTNGTTATITPDEGYEIESVLLNGKDMGKVNEVTGLKTGDKLVVTFRKTAGEDTDMDNRIKQQLGKTWLMARSERTAGKNVKVTFKTDEDTKALLEEIQNAGYTVKYRYFRSLKKSAKKNAASYKTMYTKPVTTYWNTYGQKGKMYYYRVSILVYDKDGKQMAKTNLSQCKYANRLWTK